MPGIDEKALDAAMEAYCIHLSGRPDRGRLANAIAAYNAALTPAASEAVKVKRLQDAIEGECEGLAIDEKQARSILDFVEHGHDHARADADRRDEG